MNIRHIVGTALKDIPLISRGVQDALSGKVTPGPDLKNARQFNRTSKDGKKGFYTDGLFGDSDEEKKKKAMAKAMQDRLKQ